VLPVTAVANWAKCPVNNADRSRFDSICSVDCAFSSVSNSGNCQNKGPQEQDHWLSTKVTSLDWALSLLSFMLLWGISWRSFIHGSHLVVFDQSSLATGAANHSNMSCTVRIFHFYHIDVPPQSRPTSQGNFSQSRPTSSGWWMPQLRPNISWHLPTCDPASQVS